MQHCFLNKNVREKNIGYLRFVWKKNTLDQEESDFTFNQ